MQNCYKTITIKRGGRAVTLDQDGTEVQFELLEDLTIDLPCDRYYGLEVERLIIE